MPAGMAAVLAALSFVCAAQGLAAPGQGTDPPPCRRAGEALPGLFQIRFEPLGADLWHVPAQPGQSAATNRGHVVNLLLARHEGRLWLVGSGPSPAFARALRCSAWQRFGLDIAEVVNPYARGEYALGNRGLPTASVWAPAPVAQTMRVSCPVCVARLRARLGDAAVDLGAEPVRLPRGLSAPRLPGATGRWGPFEWWLVPRADQAWASVWRHAAGVTMAPGVLSFEGPPDGQDAHPMALARAIEAVLERSTAAERFIGDTGAPAGVAAVRQQMHYWQRLWQAAQQGVGAGGTLPVEPPMVASEWHTHERHALNWQRAWRLAEDALLAMPPR